MTLSAGREKNMAFVCGEKTGRKRAAMQAAPLIVLDAESSWSEEGAAWKASMRHV